MYKKIKINPEGCNEEVYTCHILSFKWQIKEIQVFLLLPFTVIIYVKLGITHLQAETSGRLRKTTEEIFSLWNLSSSQSPKEVVKP